MGTIGAPAGVVSCCVYHLVQQMTGYVVKVRSPGLPASGQERHIPARLAGYKSCEVVTGFLLQSYKELVSSEGSVRSSNLSHLYVQCSDET